MHMKSLLILDLKNKNITMNNIQISFGNVTEKNIITKNHFVSHMIEHIAWRMGMKINIIWEDKNWKDLGKALGKEIAKNQILQKSSIALGMIDDGTAEVKIFLGESKCIFTSSKNIDLDWFLQIRCEQIGRGIELLRLIEGLSEGIGATIEICVFNLEDQHHTWEGIFRGIGIALSKMYTPKSPVYNGHKQIEKNISIGEISILERSLDTAIVSRGTAETGVTIGVDFTKKRPNSFQYNVDPSINISEINILFELLAKETNCTLQINFNAKILSSSHVVLEDIGMVLGKSLLEILKLRMETYGMNCAGSSLQTIEDDKNQNIRTGISVEGRKFWRYIPFDGDYKNLQKKLLIGKNVFENLRTEDLDDFIDGLCGGMTCSIAVHIKELSDPTDDWKNIFITLGKAIKETFTINPYRKGVPAGVKATLS